MNEEAEPMPPRGPVAGTPLDAAIAQRRRNTTPRQGKPLSDARWPMDLHPAAMDRHAAPTLEGTKGELEKLGRSFAAAVDTYNQFGVDSPGEWNKKAKPATTQVVRAASQQLDRVKSAAEQVDKSITAALSTKLAPAYSAEIRQLVRASGNPQSEIMQAINRGDHDVVSSCLSAPAYALGLDAEKVAVLRELAAKTFAPDLTARRDASRAHAAALERALTVYSEKVGALLKATDPTNRDRLMEAI